MKKLLPLVLMFLPGSILANPSFTVGSNPYETVHAYPHDILKWPGSGVFLSWNPQTLPWQGDVTDIDNRPSESYTNNYQEVEFAPPSGYEGDPGDVHSWMRVSSYVYRQQFTLGSLHDTKYGKFLVGLSNTSLNMELAANGVARAAESDGGETEYRLVPFEGETNSAKDDYEVKLVFARQLFQNPFGFKVRYIHKSSSTPDGYVKFTRDGTTYVVPHLTWGWATTGCNHIFGYSSINADAFFQNSYSVFKGRQLDFQASYEHNGNHKSGIRYRTRREDGENYQWQYDEGSEFEGSYNVDQYWKDRQSAKLLRAYSKIGFWRIGDFDAGVLFFLQRGSLSETEVSKLVDSDPDSRDDAKEYIIETNPFFNYRFKGGYLDFGMLVELSRTGMNNTVTRWNDVSHTDQADVLRSSSPYTGWSPSWESFSHGSEWFFATGFEANSSIGVYKRTALLTRLTVLRKYTRSEKIYGQSEIPDGGSSFEFHQTHRRNNYKAETWMTGAFGLSYGWGPVQTYLTLQLPLGYLIRQNTKLRDNAELLFEHEKRSMWQVQQPTSMRLMVVYALGS